MPHGGNQQLREWVAAWRRAGPKLREIELRELLAANTAQAVRDLYGDTMPACLPPPEPWSGLVEQQARFTHPRK